MKKSLEHLPQEKQAELKCIVPIICKMCDDVEMIVLFGSHARGDYREDSDLTPDRKSGAPSDYDILVVCRHKSSVAHHLLWHSISQQCNGLDSSIPFRIIVHDIKFMKKRLKEIHYFFSDIVKEGCLLYTSGKYELTPAKELTPEQQLIVVEEHFEHWFVESKEFFLQYKAAFDRQSYKIASFELHQSAECAYKTLLLVYKNYSSHDHFLVSMGRKIREFLPGMEEIFPCETEADKELFKLFDYAYIGARYDPDFEISKNDLEYLSGRVKLLLELTEKLCGERIKSLKKDCRGKSGHSTSGFRSSHTDPYRPLPERPHG